MANYKIIGGDGRQYGPVTPDELRQWIAEGRLNAQSLIQFEGASEWKPLGNFPEFADAINPIAAPPQIAAPSNPTEWSSQILAREPDLRFGECLSAGFAFFKSNPGFVIGIVTLNWLLTLVLNLAGMFLPGVGGILQLLLCGALTGGLYLATLRRMRGEPAKLGNLFDGFKLCFVQLMLAGAITKLLSGFATMLCVLPGVYLMIAWIFALPLVADKRLEFWSAMELSRKVATRVWFQLFLLLLLLLLPFIAVQMVATFKLTVTIFRTLQEADFDVPRWLSTLVQDWKGFALQFGVFALVGQVVFLLCQFFTVGALMRAYENLFGERKP
jgi:hypothetical protein